jgi:hypothetical protein
MAFGKYDLKMKAGFTLSSFALLLKFLAPINEIRNERLHF